MSDKTSQEPGSTAAGGVHRRLVLRAAAGSVLAASGLFLPAIADETSAKSGANAGKLGGRRGRNRRGRNRNRDHGDKKQDGARNDDQPRGGIRSDIFAGVRYAPRAGTQELLDLLFQTRNDNDTGWVERFRGSMRPQETTAYKSDVTLLRAYVNASIIRIVEIENPWVGPPWVRVLDEHNKQLISVPINEGQTLIHEGLPTVTLLTVKRISDTRGYKNFAITVVVPGYPIAGG